MFIKLYTYFIKFDKRLYIYISKFIKFYTGRFYPGIFYFFNNAMTTHTHVRARTHARTSTHKLTQAHTSTPEQAPEHTQAHTRAHTSSHKHTRAHTSTHPSTHPSTHERAVDRSEIFCVRLTCSKITLQIS